jgi:acetyl esterase/lipase
MRNLSPSLLCTGYIAGSPITFDTFATVLSHALRTSTNSPAPIPIFAYAYPLGPAAAISEQVDLGLHTYAWLARTLRDGALAAGAACPPRIILVGDSAGGGIAALLAQRLAAASNSAAANHAAVAAAEPIAAGAINAVAVIAPASCVAATPANAAPPPPPSPACIVLLSPSLEIRIAGGTLTTNARRDVMLCPAVFRLLMAVLETNPKHTLPPDGLHAPCFSSIHGSWAGLPPVFAWAAEAEALADHAARAAAAIRAAGGRMEEEVAPHSFHEMPVWAHAVPEGAAALERIARFVSRCLEEDGQE